MIQLLPDHWVPVTQAVGEELPFVQPTMMLQRRFPGEIWVDSPETPTVVIGLFPKDFFAWGDLSRPGVHDVLRRARGGGTDTLGLEQALAAAWPEGYERLPHIGHRHTGTLPASLPLPPGFRLEPIQPANLDLVRAIWPDYAARNTIGDFLDYDDFFRSGYGFVAIDEATDRAVSCCAAIAVSRERADHGLDTLPEYERRGLATAVSLATVQEGLRRGLRPVWWTEASNLASRRVAEKIGFSPAWSIDLFCRNA